ncbi:ribonuclease H-like domain-containing protein [Tanacetum coccineum]
MRLLSPVVKRPYSFGTLALLYLDIGNVHQLGVKNAFFRMVHYPETVYMQTASWVSGFTTSDNGGGPIQLTCFVVDDIIFDCFLLQLLFKSIVATFCRKFASELLERLDAHSVILVVLSFDTDSKLSADGDPVSDPTLYRSLAGALQYLTFTRPDIFPLYAVQQFVLTCMILESLISLLSSASCAILGWVAHYTWSTSVVVIVFFLATIYFVVFKDKLPLSLQCWKLEYRGVANAVAELVGYHIEIDIHFVRDLVAAGHIRVLHVPSHYQYADIFTKGLPTVLFDEFRSSLSVRSSPAQTAGGC